MLAANLLSGSVSLAMESPLKGQRWPKLMLLALLLTGSLARPNASDDSADLVGTDVDCTAEEVGSASVALERKVACCSSLLNSTSIPDHDIVQSCCALQGMTGNCSHDFLAPAKKRAAAILQKAGLTAGFAGAPLDASLKKKSGKTDGVNNTGNASSDGESTGTTIAQRDIHMTAVATSSTSAKVSTSSSTQDPWGALDPFGEDAAPVAPVETTPLMHVKTTGNALPGVETTAGPPLLVPVETTGNTVEEGTTVEAALVGTTPAEISTTLSLYNCTVSPETPISSWSKEQHDWCCSQSGPGCPSAPAAPAAMDPYNCDLFSSYWSEARRTWCCMNRQKGCSSTTVTSTTSLATLPTTRTTVAAVLPGLLPGIAPISGTTTYPWTLPYTRTITSTPSMLEDCWKGVADGLADWAPKKARWCCTQFQIGCGKASSNSSSRIEDSQQYDCWDGLYDKHDAWSDKKVEWCCRHQQLGCSKSKDIRMA